MIYFEKAEEMAEVETRLRTLLPETYRDREDEVRPVSMGSASLKYAADGQVAWDEIWGSFCDLAMAGGPPHRGTFLQSALPAEIIAEPEIYRGVTQEICRGVHMVTGLYAEQSAEAGWVRMHCTSAAMAGWLARAIVMENIAARFQGLALYLPAGPRYRIEREIKNVITAVAKTCHYWLDHMSDVQHQEVAAALRGMERTFPLIPPGSPKTRAEVHAHEQAADRCGVAIQHATHLQLSQRRYPGWLGVECADAANALQLVRLLVASNVMVRREGTSIFLPIDPSLDPEGKIIAGIFESVYRYSIR